MRAQSMRRKVCIHASASSQNLKMIFLPMSLEKTEEREDTFTEKLRRLSLDKLIIDK